MVRYSLIAFFSALLLASPALADDLVADCGVCGSHAADEAQEQAEGEEPAGCEHCGTDECTCDHHDEAAGCEHCGTADCTCDHHDTAENEAAEADDAAATEEATE